MALGIGGWLIGWCWAGGAAWFVVVLGIGAWCRAGGWPRPPEAANGLDRGVRLAKVRLRQQLEHWAAGNRRFREDAAALRV